VGQGVHCAHVWTE